MGVTTVPWLLALKEHELSWHLDVVSGSATGLSDHWPEHLRRLW